MPTKRTCDEMLRDETDAVAAHDRVEYELMAVAAERAARGDGLGAARREELPFHDALRVLESAGDDRNVDLSAGDLGRRCDVHRAARLAGGPRSGQQRPAFPSPPNDDAHVRVHRAAPREAHGSACVTIASSKEWFSSTSPSSGPSGVAGFPSESRPRRRFRSSQDPGPSELEGAECCSSELRTFGPSLGPAQMLISAEEERFELPVGCPTAVFKTAALDHSATPPNDSPNVLA